MADIFRFLSYGAVNKHINSRKCYKKRFVFKENNPLKLKSAKIYHQQKQNPKMSKLTPKSKSVSYLDIILTQLAHFDIHQISFSHKKNII